MEKRDLVKLLVGVIIVIVLLAGGYLYTYNNRAKPLSPEEIELYEQIARNVYEQGDGTIVEAPADIEVETSSTSIKVTSTNRSGKVIARLQNGELSFDSSTGQKGAVASSCAGGVLALFIGVLILWLLSNTKKIAKYK